MKLGIGAFAGISAVTSAGAIYQKRKDKNLRKLLALAKQHFMFDDVLASWLLEEPSFSHVHEGGLVRADGQAVAFEIDADTLKIVEKMEN
ncbi:hypothetical protein Hs20B_14040 [Lactococcus insecticola]|uniref:PepSY domain-containing protein n=1 Tax=Pseudolactococcus insecticola TaxID=2709158 RepID=A0A6A0B7X2_9LACT|nr:hypothetical protein Hs20B_14040 [Lactococcus insecticola]